MYIKPKRMRIVSSLIVVQREEQLDLSFHQKIFNESSTQTSWKLLLKGNLTDIWNSLHWFATAFFTCLWHVNPLLISSPGGIRTRIYHAELNRSVFYKLEKSRKLFITKQCMCMYIFKISIWIWRIFFCCWCNLLAIDICSMEGPYIVLTYLWALSGLLEALFAIQYMSIYFKISSWNIIFFFYLRTNFTRYT